MRWPLATPRSQEKATALQSRTMWTARSLTPGREATRIPRAGVFDESTTAFAPVTAAMAA